jgi:hypothetical protein
MKTIDQLLAEQQALAAQDVLARQLFGGLWQGEHSSWDVLEHYIRWVVEFRGLCLRHGLSGRVIEVAARPTPDMSAVHALQEAVRAALPVLASLRLALGWPEDYLADAPIETVTERIAALAAALDLGPRWAAFESARQAAIAGLAAEMVRRRWRVRWPSRTSPRRSCAPSTSNGCRRWSRRGPRCGSSTH